MLFIIISIFSAILAGSGVGGGSIFILLITAFNLLDYKTSMGYNLIMFVVVGIAATMNNIKSKKFDIKIFFKIIFLCLIGSYIGVHFAKIIDEQDLKKYFYIFILIIGIYEIISSLISFKKGRI
ncbi:MAG: sulfite exporter TauE/SafE family protein [Clostridia bacterium]|nr:sulfite exporter TauE/SafE family protein [Clostridia bacterium]MDD4386440.1 sulfite exporter TauE/SafE family protein [Clostridia bacterium]